MKRGQFIIGRKIIVFIFICTIIFISNCSTTFKLQRQPSEQFLISIKPNNETKISYNFKSLLPEPYTFQSQVDILLFPLNSAYKDNLDAYMKTKFMKIVENEEIHNIHYKLITCNINIYPAILGKSAYRESVQLQTDVKIYKNNKLLDEKNIDAVGNTMSKSINYSLIMIDKYLVSLGL